MFYYFIFFFLFNPNLITSLQTLCNPGSISVNNSCVLCPFGSFSLYPNSTDCEKCPRGTYQFSGKTFCMEASRGYFVSNKGSYTEYPCSPGTYSPIRGMHQCLNCSKGFYQTLEGQASCVEASPGFYVSTERATEQKPCLYGSFASLKAQQLCILCSQGTYQPLNGSSACLKAPKGHFVNQKGSATFFRCPQGFYSNIEGLTKCMYCKAGYYQPSTGSVECLAAPVGSFSQNNASTSVMKCKPGTYNNFSANTYCIKCPPGYFQPLSGQIQCEPAPIGHFVLKWGNIKSYPCIKGTYSGRKGQQYCQLCPPGTYQPQTGKSSCKEASNGYYVTMSGSVRQEKCPKGTYTFVKGGKRCFGKSDMKLLLLQFSNFCNISKTTFVSANNSTKFINITSVDNSQASWNKFQQIANLTIQQRIFGDVFFNRSQVEYDKGFGNYPDGDFWIGLETIKNFTKNHTNVEKRQYVRAIFEMTRHEFPDRWYRAVYDYFVVRYSVSSVSDDFTGYRISIGDYNKNLSDAGDSLDNPKDDILEDNISGAQFYTREHFFVCSKRFGNSGWFFAACGRANPNGLWSNSPLDEGEKFIHWYYLPISNNTTSKLQALNKFRITLVAYKT